jgi:hypothetical protein
VTLRNDEVLMLKDSSGNPTRGPWIKSSFSIILGVFLSYKSKGSYKIKL